MRGRGTNKDGKLLLGFTGYIIVRVIKGFRVLTFINNIGYISHRVGQVIIGFIIFIFRYCRIKQRNITGIKRGFLVEINQFK